MQYKAATYSAFQKFFNRCLREWYVQYEQGTSFYYADPPGILFTRLRSKKNVNDSSVDVSCWYFGGRQEGIHVNALGGENVPKIFENLKRNVHGEHKEEIHSTLHLGYDTWYSSLIAGSLVKGYHVAFCHEYYVAFNSFYNFGRALGIDFDNLKTFPNFRLLTGNLYNLPTLLNKELFKCIVLHVTVKNSKELLRSRTIYALHQMLITGGSLIVVLKEPSLLPKLRQYLPFLKDLRLFVERGSVQFKESKETMELIELLGNYKIGEGLLSRTGLEVLCFYKIADKRPNLALKGHIDTK